MKDFNENRNAFPREELAKYYGKYVAWSDDGKQILASADEDQEVYEKIKAAGYDLEHVVFSYVPHPNEVFWGGCLSGIMEERTPSPFSNAGVETHSAGLPRTLGPFP